MDYIIRNYDAGTNSILVEFTGYGAWNIDLPIVDGKIPEGEELEQCIQSFAPTYIAERQAQIAAGITNTDSITSRVVPYPPQPVPVLPTMSDEVLNAKLTALITQVLQNNQVI